MGRLTLHASLMALSAVTAVTAVGGTSFAQSQAEIASKLNDDGKELMYGNKYPEATAKFREAVARVPEPKYFFNLCTSLFQEGKFDEALTACNAVSKNNPSAELSGKADKLAGRIKDEASAQHIDLHPGGGGGQDPARTDPVGPGPGPDPSQPPDPSHPPDPTNPPQQAQYRPAVGRPPAQGVFMATKADNHYTWTLGVDLMGGGGQLGRKDYYGNAAAGIRFKGDYLLDRQQRFGAEAYVQYQHLGAGKNQDAFSVSSIDVLDLGIGLYKHFCLAERVCLTPLLGVQLAFMGPAGDTATDSSGEGTQLFNYLGVGGRGELNLAYAFGRRNEHVLQVMGGVNVYSKALQDPSAGDGLGTAMEVGLDKGGAVAYLGVGYMYRFNTPLGSSPFVTLE